MIYSYLDSLFSSVILELNKRRNHSLLFDYRKGLVEDINTYSSEQPTIWYITDSVNFNLVRSSVFAGSNVELLFLVLDSVSSDNDKVFDLHTLVEGVVFDFVEILNNILEDGRFNIESGKVTPIVKFKAKNTYSGLLLNLEIKGKPENRYCI